MPATAASALPLTVFAMASVVMSVHDVRHQRIPNLMVLGALAMQLGGMVVVTALSTFGLGSELVLGSGLVDALLRAMLAGMIGFVGMLAIAVSYPPGLGGGDVKLAALVGSMLGWFGWLQVLLATALAMGIIGATALGHIIGRARPAKSMRIPLAPLVFLASWVSIVSIGLVATAPKEMAL